MNHLRLFGGAVLDAHTGPVTGRAAQRHRIALLALLATTRRLYRSRDQLITLLWPENDSERGRKLLSDSIYRVNQALGGDAIAGTGDDVRLNRNQLTCDVAEFEAAAEAGEWRRVVELYRGPFLDGFFVPGSPDFDQWMDSERAHYFRAACKAHEALAAAATEGGRTTEAVEWWQKLAELAPDDSRVTMQLMRALEAAGNRAGALRQARVHATVLRETIGVEPDKAILELTTKITRNSTVPASTGSTIAVLPFNSVNDPDNNTYFADGISEELIFLLSRTRGLQVASRTSSFAYRDMRMDVREVAQRLNVSWILEGSVRRSGNMLRVSAQLIDAANGFQVWSESFDRTQEDIFSIHAEIASAIVGQLMPVEKNFSDVMISVGGRRTPDPETYDCYLQARFHWHRRTEESLEMAVSLLEKVVAREPSYARAWVGLADAYAVMAFYDFIPPLIAFPRADSAARRAIQLDATLAAPHATIAYVELYYRWNWAAAEDGFRRAIALEPTNSTAHQWYANLLTARGRFDEAEVSMRRAAELDPLSMVAHAAIGWVMIFANQCERAIRHLHGSLLLDPDFCLSHYWMGQALMRNGQPKQALHYMQRTFQLAKNPKQPSARALAGLARAHAAAGETAEARRILDALLEEERNGRYMPSFQFARVYQALGDIPQALTRFERAYEERAHSMVYLRVDPQLLPLMREPRFRKLVELVEDASREVPTRLRAS
ncbi:MAG: tetratricopeptide repeat protein [Gemmatimonadaceae bacterium]